MTIAFEWDVKPQTKQNKQSFQIIVIRFSSDYLSQAVEEKGGSIGPDKEILFA